MNLLTIVYKSLIKCFLIVNKCFKRPKKITLVSFLGLLCFIFASEFIISIKTTQYMKKLILTALTVVSLLSCSNDEPVVKTIDDSPLEGEWIIDYEVINGVRQKTSFCASENQTININTKLNKAIWNNVTSTDEPCTSLKFNFDYAIDGNAIILQYTSTGTDLSGEIVDFSDEHLILEFGETRTFYKRRANVVVSAQ